MRSPAYRWLCHRCERVNERDTSACARGFPAIATGREIANARGEGNPTVQGYKSLARGTGWFAYFAALFS